MTQDTTEALRVRIHTLAHLWAQQCYFKGLGRPNDIDGARAAFEAELKLAVLTTPTDFTPSEQAAWFAGVDEGRSQKASHPGWPCEIYEADFEANTITIHMLTNDYFVAAGKHMLVPPAITNTGGTE